VTSELTARLVKDHQAAEPPASSIPLIPLRSRRYGPLVIRRRWRLFGCWAVVFGASWLLAAHSSSPRIAAFAIGLMFPGAGFLYDGSLSGAALAVIALLVFFPGSFVNWFSSGQTSAPLVAWLGGAALSAWFIGANPSSTVALVTPFASIGVLFSWAVINRVTFRAATRQAAAHNAELAQIQPLLRDLPNPQAEPELTPGQLAVARSFYDKALQPLNQWDGFTFAVDQWQTHATRYQLYAASWKLSAIDYLHTPAFLGYSQLAQKNLILKNLDRRIWEFWFWENLWGNFEFNPDPVRRDNIMVTGFMSHFMGLYETMTGDRYFDQPGAMTYRWNDKKIYKYDQTSITAALLRNYKRYDLNCYPCEPGLVYSMCNVWGFTGLKMHDRLRGTNNWEAIRERAERSFEDELLLPDGRICALLFTKAGLQAPTISSLLGESATMQPMLGIWPNKAERVWQVMKRQFLEILPDGSVNIKLKSFGWDTLYMTNFSITAQNRMIPCASILMSAILIGDTEIADALSKYVDSKYGPAATMAIKLGLRKGLWYDIVERGKPESWRTGPALADVPYPDVLVARAVTDGQALTFVLRPGGKKRATAAHLGLSRLVPDRRYTVTGAVEREVVGDATGRASIVVNVGDRLEVRVAPKA
jgi:hypothetical protein